MLILLINNDFRSLVPITWIYVKYCCELAVLRILFGVKYDLLIYRSRDGARLNF